MYLQTCVSYTPNFTLYHTQWSSPCHGGFVVSCLGRCITHTSIEKCLINSLIQAWTAQPRRDLNTRTQLISSPKLWLTLFDCSLHQWVRAFFRCQFNYHNLCCHGGFLCLCHSFCNPLTSIEKILATKSFNQLTQYIRSGI